MRIGSLGVWEILLILVVILLIFGPRRLPEMAKGIGQSVREFRKGVRDIKDDISKDEPAKPPTVTVNPATVSPAAVTPAATSTEKVVTAPAPAAQPVAHSTVTVTPAPAAGDDKPA